MSSEWEDEVYNQGGGEENNQEEEDDDLENEIDNFDLNGANFGDFDEEGIEEVEEEGEDDDDDDEEEEEDDDDVDLLAKMFPDVCS